MNEERNVSMAQDLQFIVRALAQRPGYSLVTVLVLALAIGANATVFGVFNGFFLRPLPYPQGDRLVIVHNAYPKFGLLQAGTSIPDYLDRRAEAPSLEDLALYTWGGFALGSEGAPEQVTAIRATPSLFDVLGVAPQLGRAFTADETTIGNDRVVVLSDTLWRTRFGARGDILGNDIQLDGSPYRVIGVMPEGFHYPRDSVRLWLPFAFTPEQTSDAERGNEFSESVGRLRPGATIDGLSAELDAIVQRNAERLGPEAAALVEATGFTARARSLRQFLVGDLTAMLLVLQASVLAVLLIACANVANLQLARIAGRRKELTVRAVLGASQRRLAGLVLAESLLLAMVGAGIGLVLAHGGLELVRLLGLERADQGFRFALDPTVVAATVAAALLAALMSGLVPVIALLRGRLAEAVNEAGRLGSGGRSAQAWRNGLVVVQIALSLALLVGAGLLTRGFYQLQQQGPGFDPHHVLTANLVLPASRYPDADARGRFTERAIDALQTLPGVDVVGYTTSLPFGPGDSMASLVIDGYTAAAGAAQPHAHIRTINAGFFRSLQIPILEGRNFEPREADRVAVVDENFARRYGPNGGVLGERVRLSNGPDDEWYTIVGVVPAIKHGSLVEAATKETVYWHHLQMPAEFATLTLRTTVPPEQLTRLAVDTITTLDPELPLFNIMAMTNRIANSLGPQRTPMVLSLIFATVAFTLAVIGVYAVLTWAVIQRFGELGVRMALGARGSDIMRLVVGQGGRLTLIGLGIGSLLALAVGRVIAAQMQHVSGMDPAVFAVVIVGLAVAAMLATWLPARRAGHIHPMAALRRSAQ
jgi:predicted permease